MVIKGLSIPTKTLQLNLNGLIAILPFVAFSFILTVENGIKLGN